MSRFWNAVAITALAAACMPAAGTQPAVPRSSIVPLIDAHQHTMSPAAVALAAPQPAPAAVTLPAPLADLLAARATSADAAGYFDVFDTDMLLFAEEQGRWWSGQARVLDAIDNFPAGLDFVPVRFAMDGKAGFVAGLLRDASGADTHDFMLGVRQGEDGRWRIASEMKQRIMPPTYSPSIGADQIVASLDDAGIRYATVLSLGYWFGNPEREIADRETKTRAENDWTLAETAQHPDRLLPFCGVNPLADYAIAELERCAANPRVRGMKLHRQSRVDLANPDHLEKIRRFFRAANGHGLAIVIHLRGSAEPYLRDVFPEAPDVPIQIAHMGSGWTNAALLADAIQAGKPGTANLWLDWTQALPIAGLWGHGPSEGLSGTMSDADKQRVVGIMRRIGLDRILYGTDMVLAWNPTPREWWRKTVLTLPLTDAEVQDIADNLPPYVRERGR